MSSAKRTLPGRLSGIGGHVVCPHCQTGARVRTSRQAAPTVRDLAAQCTNIECGHTFVVQMTVVRTIVPSRMPRPDIHLPIAPPRAPITRRPAFALNDNLQAANDGATPTGALG